MPVHENESWKKRRMEIDRLVRKAPGPPKKLRPKWMGEGDEIEEATDFWNRMAEIWDEMETGLVRKLGQDSWQVRLFQSVFTPTDAPVRVLDVGCGTGHVFNWVWARLPNAVITGIDRSPAMLKRVVTNHSERTDQFSLIEGCCLTTPFGGEQFDYITSKLTLHHFPPHTKVALYEKIRKALKPGGRYIELDQSATEAEERRTLQFYQDYISTLPRGAEGGWNYDITLSVPTQMGLLREAGFVRAELLWKNRERGMALLVADR